MNAYDSTRMADILAPLGYQPVDGPEDADMIILNTCHIREKASEKLFSELGRLRVHKEKKEENGQSMIMAVAGCVAQAEGKEIGIRAPYVDMVFGPQTYHELPEMIAKATNAFGKNRIINTDFPAESKFDFLPKESNQGSAAYLSIQEGCDKFCTFCVVPYTRGSEFSRPTSAILSEAKELAARGAKEITLLGQNVNAYHGEGVDGKDWGLGRLIREVAEIDGIERLRYTTSHPCDVQDDLIEAHRDCPQLMPFLHLPVQSGSDTILKAMNRKHTADDYRRIIDRFRDASPDIAVSSDFIVAFPGETDSDFEDTMKIVEEINYAFAYSFIYSARPGTPAAAMKKLVPKHVASERIQRLQALLNEQQLAYNQSMVGRTLPVLLDRKGQKSGQFLGRSPHNLSVHVEANDRLHGTIADVHITAGHANSLHGDIVTSETIMKSA